MKCLIQLLPSKVLSIEERVFFVEHEGNKYTDLVQIFICGEQQNLQCTVIPHARLMS
jgi:hypothetical protein